jgi:thiosulfate dehydrogenase [quinone] large subunit
MRLPGEVLQGILARWALVVLRVYLGTVFLVAAVPKLNGDFTRQLVEFVENVGLKRGHPFYRPFLDTVVLPNAHLFGLMIPWGELLVGALLLIGLLTRVSAAGAMLIVVNYMLVKGAWLWTPSSNDAAFAVIALALLIGAAGRTLGVDGLLARRWPRSPFW